MKTKVFPLKDGGSGTAYYPENGDEYIANFDKVGENQHPALVNGKPAIIKNRYLGVTNIKDGKDYTITISEGQQKVLDKTPDLKGKVIVFETYEHKKFGKQLGARVKKTQEIKR